EGRGGARSPVGVPPRHLRQRTNAAVQLQHALPGTWSARTVPMVWKTVRGSTGVTRAFLSQSRELLADRSSCRPGVKPEPPESKTDEADLSPSRQRHTEPVILGRSHVSIIRNDSQCDRALCDGGCSRGRAQLSLGELPCPLCLLQRIQFAM